MKNIFFRYKGKKINLNVKPTGFFTSVSGLMFTRKSKAKALLFQFSKPRKMSIHSLFVSFPFIAVWLDKNGKVIEIRKIKPYTLSVRPKKPSTKLIEIPCNKVYRRKIEFLVGD